LSDDLLAPGALLARTPAGNDELKRPANSLSVQQRKLLLLIQKGIDYRTLMDSGPSADRERRDRDLARLIEMGLAIQVDADGKTVPTQISGPPTRFGPTTVSGSSAGAGPATRLGSPTQFGPSTQFGPATRTGPVTQFGQTARTGPATQFGPATRTGPVTQFGQTARTGPATQFGPPTRTGNATRTGPPTRAGPVWTNPVSSADTPKSGSGKKPLIAIILVVGMVILAGLAWWVLRGSNAPVPVQPAPAAAAPGLGPVTIQPANFETSAPRSETASVPAAPFVTAKGGQLSASAARPAGTRPPAKEVLATTPGPTGGESAPRAASPDSDPAPQNAATSSQSPSAPASVAPSTALAAYYARPDTAAAPNLVARVDPDFPAEAARAGVKAGTVRARMRVGADGSVAGVDILQSNPSHVFDRAVTRALSQWKFEPTGQPRTVDHEVEFR
jgi:periplasmic protein TonB